MIKDGTTICNNGVKTHKGVTFTHYIIGAEYAEQDGVKYLTQGGVGVVPKSVDPKCPYLWEEVDAFYKSGRGTEVFLRKTDFDGWLYGALAKLKTASEKREWCYENLRWKLKGDTFGGSVDLSRGLCEWEGVFRSTDWMLYHPIAFYRDRSEKQTEYKEACAIREEGMAYIKELIKEEE